MSNYLKVVIILLLGSAQPSLALASLRPASPGMSATQIANRAEESLRGDQTVIQAQMTVRSPRLTQPRMIEFTSWDDRLGKRSFTRMEAPAKDKGTGFLKVHPNLWMYIPRVERTVRIPPSMMLQSWMGSDLTNDDLVRESSQTDDYDHRLLGIEDTVKNHPDREAYVVEYIPHEDTPVVWGKIIAWIDTERDVTLRQEFYDEDDVLIRTMQYQEIQPVGKRWVSHLWILTPEQKEGHETQVRIKRIEFDAEIDDTVFTKRNLKKGLR